jgi:hypothetical protein
LLWLQQAGLIHRVFCSAKPGLPLSAYDDVSAFKIYLCDGGLLRKMAQLPAEIFATDSAIYTEFKGAMAENYILQSLVAQSECMPRYWTSGATAEVDYIWQYALEVIPIEVKSGINVRGRSLFEYSKRFQPEKIIRYSLLNLNRDGKLLNIPLFLADWTTKLLSFI